MKLLQLGTFLFLICMMIVSCGGGGSDSGAGGTPMDENLVVEQGIVNDEDEPEDILTGQLMADSDFLFKSSQPLSIELANQGSVAYPEKVSLCYLKSDDTVNYGECLYSGDIGGQDFSRDFSIQNDVDKLALVLWYFEPEFRQQINLWQRADGNSWLVEI